MPSTTQATVKALQFRPMMLLSELNSTNWISRGTLRNTSSTQASGRESTGNSARSKPNTTPARVPISIAARVSRIVTLAPSSMNSRSLQVKLVIIIISPSIPEQAPGQQARNHHDQLGDQVIKHCSNGEEFKGAEGLGVVVLGDAGQVIVESYHHAQGRHQHGPDHLVGERVEHDAQQLRDHDQPVGLRCAHAQRASGAQLGIGHSFEAAAKVLCQIARVVMVIPASNAAHELTCSPNEPRPKYRM